MNKYIQNPSGYIVFEDGQAQLHMELQKNIFQLMTRR